MVIPAVHGAKRDLLPCLGKGEAGTNRILVVGGERTKMSEARAVVLYSERLMLREIEEDDWLALHVVHSDPEVTRFWEKLRTVEQTRESVREAIHANQVSPRHSYDFAIIRTSDQALIGQIGIGAAECRHHGSLDFGYALARQYWGNGYMTEALKTLLRFGFTELGAHRICAECDPSNLASARVMEKAGMRCEAHFRKIRIYAGAEGDWHDSLLYAVLDDEWHSQ